MERNFEHISIGLEAAVREVDWCVQICHLEMFRACDQLIGKNTVPWGWAVMADEQR